MLQRGMQWSFKYMNLNIAGAQTSRFTSDRLEETQLYFKYFSFISWDLYTKIVPPNFALSLLKNKRVFANLPNRNSRWQKQLCVPALIRFPFLFCFLFALFRITGFTFHSLYYPRKKLIKSDLCVCVSLESVVQQLSMDLRHRSVLPI